MAKREKMFNGKPMSHWERKAHELVVYQLVRAAQLDIRSVVGKLASERLMALANAIDPTVVSQVLEERDQCRAGMARVLVAMGVGSSQPKRRQKAARG